MTTPEDLGLIEQQRLEKNRLLAIEVAEGQSTIHPDEVGDSRQEEIRQERQVLKHRRLSASTMDELAAIVARQQELELEAEALATARRQRHARVVECRLAREAAEGELRVLQSRVHDLRRRRKQLARGINDADERRQQAADTATYWNEAAKSLQKQLDDVSDELVRLLPLEERGMVVTILEKPIR